MTSEYVFLAYFKHAQVSIDYYCRSVTANKCSARIFKSRTGAHLLFEVLWMELRRFLAFNWIAQMSGRFYFAFYYRSFALLSRLLACFGFLESCGRLQEFSVKQLEIRVIRASKHKLLPVSFQLNKV